MNYNNFIRTYVLYKVEVYTMIINPDAPDEYKYETDYRKIPREYLNPNIPEGRRNVKWSRVYYMY
ncbi:hypothetical protein BUY46_02120 [Staphylococcus devriesei]|nr:hypothetical protein BUY46_02120 [Staphylococcus devriesei]